MQYSPQYNSDSLIIRLDKGGHILASNFLASPAVSCRACPEAYSYEIGVYMEERPKDMGSPPIGNHAHEKEMVPKAAC